MSRHLLDAMKGSRLQFLVEVLGASLLKACIQAPVQSVTLDDVPLSAAHIYIIIDPIQCPGEATQTHRLRRGFVLQVWSPGAGMSLTTAGKRLRVLPYRARPPR